MSKESIRISYQKDLKKFKDKANFTVVMPGDCDYPYARSISNSRFHYQPGAVAFCQTSQDAADCLVFCKKNKVPFRIRSGGHHHEGMSSGNELMIIDLSAIGRDAETNKTQFEYIIGNDPKRPEFVWVPSATKLDVVYKELREKGMVIPGGGCQSVNVGGLTQGGGWGVHVRKYGLACDQMVDAEVVLADGYVGLASKHKNAKQLLWSLRGGGGGNFGVVTRFKFRLCPLNEVMTTFGIFWKKKVDIINMITRWAELHEQDTLEDDLSCTTNMWRVNNEGKKPPFSEPVRGRMGGNFYGTKKQLIKILEKEFGSLIPMKDGEPVISSNGAGLDSYFSAINESPIDYYIKEEPKKSATVNVGSANKTESDKQKKRDKKLKLLAQTSLDYVYAQFNLITGETENVAAAPGHSSGTQSMGDENKKNPPVFEYDVLPSPPNTTCDMPHPHKVTSLFPKNNIDHRKLANQVYEQLADAPFLADVNRYMVWHCQGGAMHNKGFEEASSFAWRHKPYLLQLQSWWNHSGQLRNDKSRDENYTQWVNKFRKDLDSKGMTEGAFINFVDRDIVPDISSKEGRNELLKHYYGKNLDKLQAAKTEFDPGKVFKFPMGVLPYMPEGTDKVQAVEETLNSEPKGTNKAEDQNRVDVGTKNTDDDGDPRADLR